MNDIRSNINKILLLNETIRGTLNEELNIISPQEAIDRGFFGPVFHGTSSENHKQINTQGFQVFSDVESSGNNISNGYINQPYYNNIPPPLHHLGFGIYFTTKKTIAKKFNANTTKNLSTYYLDVPKLETINFGAPKTMMNWWIKNGYDPNLARESERGRIQATTMLTNHLKNKYDAVWFKGASLYTLLDGDQIVIFNPNRIYKVDFNIASDMEIGSKVIKVDTTLDVHDRYKLSHIQNGTVGVILRKDKIQPQHKQYAPYSDYRYQIRFTKGGTEHNVLDFNIEPYKKNIIK